MNTPVEPPAMRKAFGDELTKTNFVPLEDIADLFGLSNANEIFESETYSLKETIGSDATQEIVLNSNLIGIKKYKILAMIRPVTDDEGHAFDENGQAYIPRPHLGLSFTYELNGGSPAHELEDVNGIFFNGYDYKSDIGSAAAVLERMQRFVHDHQEFDPENEVLGFAYAVISKPQEKQNAPNPDTAEEPPFKCDLQPA